jgi:hypothetical protein
MFKARLTDGITNQVLKYAVLVLLVLCQYGVLAQSDSIKRFNNTVRVNVTNPMIFGYQSLIFGYERQLPNSQSFSLSLGQAYFGTLGSDELDSIRLSKGLESKDKGFHISADYRWYLTKQNKFDAPCGLYVGPYASYNYFNRVNSWTLNTSDFQGDVNTDITLNIITVGAELGYQFLLGKRQRWSIDMVLLGPGIANYSLKTKTTGDLSSENEHLLFEKINEILHNRFPGMDHVIDGEGYERTGTSNTTDLGYRYMVMVGYRF